MQFRRRLRGSFGSLTLGLLALLTSCGAYSEVYPFRPAPTEGQHSVAPPGVRWATTLRGAVQIPTDGVPARQFELTIELEQPGTEGHPLWEPVELMNLALTDDEGRSFRTSRVRVADDPKSKRGKLVALEKRYYLIVFDIAQTYRFESIGRVHVTWKLRAAGQPPATITSTFVR